MRRFSTHNKVASAMATNIEFVQCVASEKKPTFLSTGMMTHDQIRAAVDIFAYSTPLVLMHSQHLSREQDLNQIVSVHFAMHMGFLLDIAATKPSSPVFAAVLGSVH